MKISRFVTAVAAGFVLVSNVPASSAQEIGSTAPGTQEGIEVITIIGKRPVSTMATVCSHINSTRLDAASMDKRETDGAQKPDNVLSGIVEQREVIGNCAGRAAVGAARI